MKMRHYVMPKEEKNAYTCTTERSIVSLIGLRNLGKDTPYGEACLSAKMDLDHCKSIYVSHSFFMLAYFSIILSFIPLKSSSVWIK